MILKLELGNVTVYCESIEMCQASQIVAIQSTVLHYGQF